MDLQGSSIRGWSRCRSPFKIRKFRTEAELEAYRQEIQAYSQNVAKKRFVCDGSAIKILDCATEGSSLDCWVKDNLKAGALFHADHALSKPGWKLWEPEKDWMMDVEQMLEDARKMKPGVPAGDDTPSAFLTAHTFVKAVPRASLNFCTSNDSFISDFILNEARREKLGHVVHNSGGGDSARFTVLQMTPTYRSSSSTEQVQYISWLRSWKCQCRLTGVHIWVVTACCLQEIWRGSSGTENLELFSVVRFKIMCSIHHADL